MHEYRTISDADELDRVILPILQANGSEIPDKGCYAAAVEFDETGAVVAYQMIQIAVFLEGMWARDHSAHLRTLHNLATDYAAETLGAKSIMTMSRKDETGERIGKLAEHLGFEKKNWNVYRREI